MVHKFFISVAMCLICGCLHALQPLNGLVKRILPGYENEFLFELSGTNSNKDYFEISSKGTKIYITGNSPVSIASGLNWYLKYYCNCSFSFCKDQNKLPNKLPEIKKTIKKEASLNCNFYLNYCTFSYTAAFWDWERWEREIDLMALNGINTPMAMVGVEAVWKNTLNQFGYTDNEIKDFLCGPAFLGWLLMGNLEKHGGPLPDEWFERQIELQKKILKRMREYGMTPVFQAFVGLVPNSLRHKYPEAEIVDQGEWMGFKRPSVLLSSDPLFEEMAEVWYEEYENLYGKTDYYAGDLFHEGGKAEGLNIAEIAHGVQKSLLEYNPDAKWFIQAWGENPKPALLAGLDKKHAVIVDLSSEYWTRWKDRKGYDGFPWVWSHITNYGGNIGLHGRLDAIVNGILDAQADSCASKSLFGIGSTPEGIEVNPIVFDLANEMRWRTSAFDLKEWVRKYADRRYGIQSKNLEQAWEIFYQTVYGTYDRHRRPSESVFCAMPSLKGKRITASAWSQCKIFYDPAKYAEGVNIFLKESRRLHESETYRYDAVDMVRQYLADLGRLAYSNLVKAYKAKDLKMFKKESALFLQVLQDQDRLLSSHESFHVSQWLKQARSISTILR